MKTIKTIAFVAALGLAPAIGFAADTAVVPEKAETKTVEYVAGMTGVT
jgi:hypothetical protein